MKIIDKIKMGNVDEADLLEYITSNDINIAIAAAESPIATETILKIAVMDKDAQVRLAALRNSNISDACVLLLSKDKNNIIAALARKECERRKL